MEISDDYPNALLEDFPPYGARLLTAVHIACIDAGGEAFGLEFSEDELQDFFDTNTHRYFSVKPRGNLKKAVDLLLKAVCTSIQNNELKLLAVRKNLEGELSLANSWVSFDNFAEWCETRSINLGDCWFDFCKDDSDIANSAAEEMDTTSRLLKYCQRVRKITIVRVLYPLPSPKKSLVARSGRSIFLAAGKQTSISAAC